MRYPIYSYKNLGINGRLGNQLWQIASTIGIAAQHGHHSNARFPADWPGRPYFNIPDWHFGITGREQDLGSEYLQDLAYFDGCEDLIREYLEPSQGAVIETAEYMEEQKKLQPELFKSSGPICSVHVRHGDSYGKEKYHPLCTVEYYERAMRTMQTQVPDVQFSFFSDDIAWCKRQFPGHLYLSPELTHQEAIGPSNRTDIYELVLQKWHNYHIIANSTFSWWGAYLSSDAAVIYPSVWFGPAYEGKTWWEMIPSSWVEIPC